MKRNTLIASLLLGIIAVVIILTFAISQNYSLPYLGGIIVQNAATTCNDSDNGVFFYSAGIISMCTGASCIEKGGDYCTVDVLTEYFCNQENKVKNVSLKCPFGCDGNICLTIGQEPKPKPQPVPAENESTEQEIKAIVCDEGWTCADKMKVYQDISCEWLKEEYCKYGCAEGSCANPSFWVKFLYWLKGK